MKKTHLHFKNQQGFNLIELMIVIAIIALLIAVGIPGYQSMIRSANEANAARTIGTIRTCQTSYAGKHQSKFAPNFAELVKSGCLDEDKFKGDPPVLDGYIFTMAVTEPSGTQAAFYSVNVDPQVATGIGATGNQHFYYDSNLGAVKTNQEGPAKKDDPSM